MTVELPKDAEGREIPLDVEFLYKANGESVKPYSFTFNRYDGFGWDMHLVGVQNSVYDPKSFYLTPPDSWEKLEEDLGKIANNPGEIVCAYFGREISDCEGCKLESCECACSNAFLRDVIERIRKLRGDGDA